MDSVDTPNIIDLRFISGATLKDGDRPTQIFCRDCGNDTLYVGKGTFITVIKCPRCGFEECIHYG